MAESKVWASNCDVFWGVTLYSFEKKFSATEIRWVWTDRCFMEKYRQEQNSGVYYMSKSKPILLTQYVED